MIDFKWHVPEAIAWDEKPAMRVEVDGHVAEAPPEPVLTVRSGTKLRRYEPLAEQHLFRDFMAAAPTAEGVEGFARRYGLLTMAPVRGSRSWDAGEPISLWFQELTAMRAAVAVIAAAHAQDGPALGRMVHRNAQGTRVDLAWDDADGRSLQHTIFDAAREPDTLLAQQIRKADDATVCWGFVQRVTDPRLRENTSVRVGLDAGRPAIRLVPRNLLGALWLQVAQVAAGAGTFRTCPRCRLPFIVGNTGLRADAEYCSNVCKQAAYRTRRAHA